MDCPHFPDVTNGFFVKWNERLERLETTERSIRELPPHFPGHVRSVKMCEPTICRRDECTYAHGRAEQIQWNRALKSCVRNLGTYFDGGFMFSQSMCYIIQCLLNSELLIVI